MWHKFVMAKNFLITLKIEEVSIDYLFLTVVHYSIAIILTFIQTNKHVSVKIFFTLKLQNCCLIHFIIKQQPRLFHILTKLHTIHFHAIFK